MFNSLSTLFQLFFDPFSNSNKLTNFQLQINILRNPESDSSRRSGISQGSSPIAPVTSAGSKESSMEWSHTPSAVRVAKGKEAL